MCRTGINKSKERVRYSRRRNSKSERMQIGKSGHIELELCCTVESNTALSLCRDLRTALYFFGSSAESLEASEALARCALALGAEAAAAAAL